MNEMDSFKMLNMAKIENQTLWPIFYVRFTEFSFLHLQNEL